MRQVKNSLMVLFVLICTQLHGQTNAEKALELGNEAVKSNRLKTNMVVKVSEKAISITTAAAGEVVSDKMKNGGKN